MISDLYPLLADSPTILFLYISLIHFFECPRSLEIFSGDSFKYQSLLNIGSMIVESINSPPYN